MNEPIQISKIKYQGFSKTVHLTNGNILELGFSACVDESNEVTSQDSNLFVKCENGLVQIFPSYLQTDVVSIGDYSIDILIKEITDESELKSYESLSQFHYKGQRLFGRSAILIATTSTPYLPKVLGYIELTTPFYVNKPRAKVLDSSFHHNGISWNRWDKETTKKYINTICRIARCVVYPEFRGVGLGQALVTHAINFARNRWQIANFKPLFLEISADMLKYVPFAESVGMHYIGDTEGNLNRIHKDLEYLLGNYNRIQNKEIVSEQQMGIVMQQKSRLKKAVEIIEKNNLSTEEFLERLRRLKSFKRLKDLQFFNGLISLPKPTYLKGLDEITENFIRRRLASQSKITSSVYDNFKCHPINAAIALENLCISFPANKRSNDYTIAIRNAFNIDFTEQENTIIKDLSISINPGEIVLVTGSSGSGKTTLLNFFINERAVRRSTKVSGKISLPINYKPVSFNEVANTETLIEFFGKKDLMFGLKLLGIVGLSDAYVYLKKYSELSKGQQFRAQLAFALITGSNTLIIDEYCSNLDPISSNVVTYRLRKLVKKLGITLIIGAAHCDNFIHSLNPDKVLRLSTAWDYEFLDGPMYSKHFSRKKQKINFQTLEFPTNKMFLNFLEKQEIYLISSTNSRNVGFVLIKWQNSYVNAYITMIKETRLSDLSLIECKKAGYTSVKELKKDLIKHNKKLKDNSIIYILSLTHFNFISQNTCKIKTSSGNG